MKTNQKGFGVVEILLLLLALGIFGGVGLYIYSSKTNKSNLSPESQIVNNVKKESTVNSNKQVKATPDKNPGYITITQWGVAARIGDKSNSDKITYKLEVDEYGDDTAYFLLKESISENCRHIGFALHKKNTGTLKYVQIGQGYYAPSAAPKPQCDKSNDDESKAIELLNSLSNSIDKYDYEFKASN